MLGVRSEQRGLLEADHLYLDYVGYSVWLTRSRFRGFRAFLSGR